MRWIANLVYLTASVFYLPVLVYQMVGQGKNRRGWGARLGSVRFVPREKRRIWVHAVSLGEVNATRTIVAKLAERFPDREVVLSTTTDTGYARACRLYGVDRVFRFPLDFSWVVDRVLDRVDPEMLVLMELEVWFNLVRTAHARGVRVVVVNGRLTERSARRFARLGWLTRSMFEKLDWVGAQDETIASRFRRLGAGADRVQVTGSMKWDTAAVGEAIEGADLLGRAMGLDAGRALWVCGSTGPDEEAIILGAYDRLVADGTEVRLAIVPRKPERFDEVACLIERNSFACVRRTLHPDEGSGQAMSARDVALGDTMGELRKFYALADVVFVGRSLVPMGGSDPMEVAAIGKPMLAGPHMENFAVATTALRERGALRTVASAEELAGEVRRMVTDVRAARCAGEAARQVVIDHQGATDVTLEGLARLMASDGRCGVGCG